MRWLLVMVFVGEVACVRAITPGAASPDARVTSEGGRTADAAVPDGGTLLSLQISSARDDGDELLADGRINLGRGHVSLGTDDFRPVLVGLRFGGVPLPAGAQIDDVHLQFQAADDIDSVVDTQLTIRVEASDDAAAFSEVTGDLTARPRSTAAVQWLDVPTWLKGERTVAQRSPDLRVLIEAIVSRPGWRSGGAIVFLIDGDGRRRASSFEKAFAPQLEIRWR